MTHDEQIAFIRSVNRRCAGELLITAEKAYADALKAKEEGRPYIAPRAGCGYDFNDTICAGEFDGKDHSYTCPKCGLTGTYRAPLFD